MRGIRGFFVMGALALVVCGTARSFDVDDIANLVRSGVSDAVIINLIRDNKLERPLTVDEVMWLENEGVSPEVLTFLTSPEASLTGGDMYSYGGVDPDYYSDYVDSVPLEGGTYYVDEYGNYIPVSPDLPYYYDEYYPEETYNYNYGYGILQYIYPGNDNYRHRRSPPRKAPEPERHPSPPPPVKAQPKPTPPAPVKPQPGPSAPGKSKPGPSTPGKSQPGPSAPGKSQPKPSTPGKSQPKPSAPGKSQPKPSAPGKSQPGRTAPDSTQKERKGDSRNSNPQQPERRAAPDHSRR